MKKAGLVLFTCILLMVTIFANSVGNVNASTAAPKISNIEGENVFIATEIEGDIHVWKAQPGEELKDCYDVMVGLGSKAEVKYPGGMWSGSEGTNLHVKLEEEPKPGWFARLLKGTWKVLSKAAEIAAQLGVIWEGAKGIRDIIKGKSLCKVFHDDWTGISNVSVFNGTISITSTRYDSVIDSCDIAGSLYFDEYGMPWANGQEITIYEDGTISEPIEVLLNATEMAFTPHASDSNGVLKVFHLGDDIYVCGFGALLPPNTVMNVYLMPQYLLPILYSPSEAIVSKTIESDAWGNLPTTFFWKPTNIIHIGEYNFWIDRDNSGSYNTGDIVNYLEVEAAGFGGIVVPIDKLGLLAPYIGLASTILVATVATAIYVKHVKCRKEK